VSEILNEPQLTTDEVHAKLTSLEMRVTELLDQRDLEEEVYRAQQRLDNLETKLRRCSSQGSLYEWPFLVSHTTQGSTHCLDAMRQRQLLIEALKKARKSLYQTRSELRLIERQLKMLQLQAVAQGEKAASTQQPTQQRRQAVALKRGAHLWTSSTAIAALATCAIVTDPAAGLVMLLVAHSRSHCRRADGDCKS
jgi:hypothetical protein